MYGGVCSGLALVPEGNEFVLEIDGSGDRRTSGDAEWLRRASGDRLLCMGRGSGDVEVLLCVVLLCRPSGDADAC